jgi:hypothetical protein
MAYRATFGLITSPGGAVKIANAGIGRIFVGASIGDGSPSILSFGNPSNPVAKRGRQFGHSCRNCHWCEWYSVIDNEIWLADVGGINAAYYLVAEDNSFIEHDWELNACSELRYRRYPLNNNLTARWFVAAPANANRVGFSISSRVGRPVIWANRKVGTDAAPGGLFITNKNDWMETFVTRKLVGPVVCDEIWLWTSTFTGEQALTEFYL